jgi:ParB/RepB/Spo0J family partition protein
MATKRKLRIHDVAPGETEDDVIARELGLVAHNEPIVDHGAEASASISAATDTTVDPTDYLDDEDHPPVARDLPTQLLEVRYVKTGDLEESPFNPRKDLGDLGDLAASIGKVGLLTPLMARHNAAGELELVFGHRRLGAAKLAGLGSVPVDIRDLSDREVLELQLVENLQRVELTPLELAAGYAELHKTHGLTVEEIAARVGKSKATVYSVLKLTELEGPGRTALENGKLPFSTALLIARIPHPKLQAEAAKEILQYGEALSYRDAADTIHRQFMLELDKAKFDPTDAALVPAAGACTVCPKRTGCQPELFRDVKSADVCTDPTCFKSKEEAWWAQQVEASKTGTGPKVLSQADAKRVLTTYGLAPGAEYVRADTGCSDDEKGRSYKQLLGRGAKAHVVLGRNERGDVLELLPKAGLKKLLDDAEIIKRREAPSSDASWKKEKEREKKKAELADRVRALAMVEIVAGAESKEPDIKFWRMLAGAMASVCYDEELELRRKLEPKWPQKWLPKLELAQLRGLVLDLALSENPTGFKAAAEFYGVNLKKLEETAKLARAKELGDKHEAKKKGKAANG